MDHTTMGKIPADYNNAECRKGFEAAIQGVKDTLPSESKIASRIEKTEKRMKLVEFMLKCYSARFDLGVPLEEDKYEISYWMKAQEMFTQRVKNLGRMQELRSSMLGMPTALKETSEADRLKFAKEGVEMNELMFEAFKDPVVIALDEKKNTVVSRYPDEEKK